MSRIVVLDSTPLGLLCGPDRSRAAERCRAWLRGITPAVDEIVIPEIADYEVRRELIFSEREAPLARLDLLVEGYRYLPITTRAMSATSGGSRASRRWNGNRSPEPIGPGRSSGRGATGDPLG